jgi:NAD(P)-dependent dehydrogenase (short-subunit alcohol dehydrogenase family)
MVASAAESVGRIHALFNNAGVQAQPRGPPRQERGPYTDCLHAAKAPLRTRDAPPRRSPARRSCGSRSARRGAVPRQPSLTARGPRQGDFAPLLDHSTDAFRRTMEVAASPASDRSALRNAAPAASIPPQAPSRDARFLQRAALQRTALQCAALRCAALQRAARWRDRSMSSAHPSSSKPPPPPPSRY